MFDWSVLNKPAKTCQKVVKFNLIAIFREEATSAKAVFFFLYGSSIHVKLEFGNVSFRGGRKTAERGEKPWEQGEDQQQTEPTYEVMTPGPEIEPRPHWWEP